MTERGRSEALSSMYKSFAKWEPGQTLPPKQNVLNARKHNKKLRIIKKEYEEYKLIKYALGFRTLIPQIRNYELRRL